MSESFVNPSDSGPEERVLTTGRRNFLRGILGVGAVLVTDGWGAIDASENTSDQQDNTQTEPDDTSPVSDTSSATKDREIEEPSSSHENSNASLNPISGFLKTIDESTQTNETFGDTIADSLVATAGVFALNMFANNDYVRLYSGNSGSEEIFEKYRRNRLKMLMSAVVVAPVVEEIVFRGIPAVGGGTDRLMPLRGIVATYAFGKAHQLKQEKRELTPSEESASRLCYEELEEKVGVEFDENKIPVPQYALGAYFWMVARRKGLAHSMFAHATTNATAFALLELGARTGGDKQRPSEILGEQ